MTAHGQRYLLLDVFTDRPFAGNPLAVFPEAAGLEGARMQAIATELNLSETVFVGAATATNRVPIRIFTPSQELPFAGHPTVGTAHLLAELGLVASGLADRSRPLVLEAGVGELVVAFDGDIATFATACPVALSPSPLDRHRAAELLGLAPEAIADDPVVASCGLPFHLVELDSLAALAEARPSSALWDQYLAPGGIEQLYLYVRNNASAPEADDETLRTRMLSTELGTLREDPATGSAAAALAGYLAEGLADRQHGDGILRLRILQGLEMGRPSEILVEVTPRRKTPEEQEGGRVRIGGRAVIVGEGHITAAP